MAEEQILKEAIYRRKSGSTPTSDDMPPPLPEGPPPDATPSGKKHQSGQISCLKSDKKSHFKGICFSMQ